MPALLWPTLFVGLHITGMSRGQVAAGPAAAQTLVQNPVLHIALNTEAFGTPYRVRDARTRHGVQVVDEGHVPPGARFSTMLGPRDLLAMRHPSPSESCRHDAPQYPQSCRPRSACSYSARHPACVFDLHCRDSPDWAQPQKR